MVSRIIFLLFSVKEKNSTKIKNKNILNEFEYLKNKEISQIMYAQKLATENVFRKKIFHLEVLKSQEEMKILWVNFYFFILETILIGKFLK